MKRLALFLAFAVACSEPEPAPGDSSAEGTATWRDAATEPDGTPRDPAHPESQPGGDPMRVWVTADGTGTFEIDEPQCEADNLTGAFEALYQGEATLDDDGGYVAVLAANDATFETPSGCTLPDLEIGLVTGVTVRGELTATTQNCDSYCAAEARAEAEASCDGETDEASCRASEEAAWEASCTTACEDETHVIVAETSLSAASLLDLQLDGASIGTVTADLEFDHVEDGSGDPVDTSP